ncbi:hypothetical protein K438DRAFT_1977085 [Mycena galopus ATCC 62051]|nr:hypothetical protein K438DRAFT_1977085 [Mycena galopus ATCC 62051]
MRFSFFILALGFTALGSVIAAPVSERRDISTRVTQEGSRSVVAWSRDVEERGKASAAADIIPIIGSAIGTVVSALESKVKAAAAVANAIKASKGGK